MTLDRERLHPDFLRQRRLESGLPPEATVHEPLPLLLMKGAAVGLVLSLTPLAFLFLLDLQKNHLEQEIVALASVEERVGNAQARLDSMATKRASLDQQTNRIATQLVAVRSGSALLEQIRQVTPQGIRLVSVEALPSKLLILGEAKGTDAFERINALALNLEAQDELLVDGTRVVKATASDNALIDFSLEARFDSSVRPTPERLRALGSEGLAVRYEQLESMGVDL